MTTATPSAGPEERERIRERLQHPLAWYPFCMVCEQPLAHWGRIGNGVCLDGLEPVYGPAPKGVRRCPDCGGRRYWVRYAMAVLGVSRETAHYPFDAGLPEDTENGEIL